MIRPARVCLTSGRNRSASIHPRRQQEGKSVDGRCCFCRVSNRPANQLVDVFFGALVCCVSSAVCSSTSRTWELTSDRRSRPPSTSSLVSWSRLILLYFLSHAASCLEQAGLAPSGQLELCCYCFDLDWVLCVFLRVRPGRRPATRRHRDCTVT